jgi:CopG antitoxin of type II toxin-antitoxin system
MAKSKEKVPALPTSLDALVEFFDTHDLGDEWEKMPEAPFDIDIQKRTHLVAIDEELIEQVSAIARARHVPAEQLINAWLKEKMFEAT